MSEQLCLDHFLDEAFVRNERAFQLCSQGQPLDSSGIEWLLSDALAIVKNLEEGADQPNPDQRDRMLELLLIVANLQEYVAHHSTQVATPGVILRRPVPPRLECESVNTADTVAPCIFSAPRST